MLWAVSLLTMHLLAHRLSPPVLSYPFYRIILLRGTFDLRSLSRGCNQHSKKWLYLKGALSLHTSEQGGATSIAFAENQLSPSLISLSPLITTHPRFLPQSWVRSSPSRVQPGHDWITWFRVFDPLHTPSSDSVSLSLPLTG